MSKTTYTFPPCCCECLDVAYEFIEGTYSSSTIRNGSQYFTNVTVSIPLCKKCQKARDAVSASQEYAVLPGMLGTMLIVFSLVFLKSWMSDVVFYVLLAALPLFFIWAVSGQHRSDRIAKSRQNACVVYSSGALGFGNKEYQRLFDELNEEFEQFACPFCNAQLTADVRARGQMAECPGCKKKIKTLGEG